MNKILKTFCCITVPLGILFCLVGYAALSSTLNIQGSAELEMPSVVYISEIGEPVYSRADAVDNGDFDGDPTNVNFPSTKFMCNLRFGSYSSVSFDVTLVNRTPFTQIFNTLKYYTTMDGVDGPFDSGENIKVTITDADGNDHDLTAGGVSIPRGGSMTCRVTLSNPGRWSLERKLLYNFEFVRDASDLTGEAAEQMTDMFERILNNMMEEITYTYTDDDGNTVTETIAAGESFDAMYGEMVVQGSGNRYMGNVSGAPAEDAAIVNALFGDALIMNVGGQDVPVSLMLKSENVYGDSKREMALYWTADPLNTEHAQGDRVYPAVCVAVYTQMTETDANGDSVTQWKQIGEDYAGTATQSDYGGDRDKTGSFVTNDWVSTAVYHGVKAGSKLSPILDALE